MAIKKTEEETIDEAVVETDGVETVDVTADESNVDAINASAGSVSNEGAQAEPTILDSVVETVSSAVETVSNVVSDGVSSIVSVVTGSAEANGSKDERISKRAEKVGVVSSDKMTKTVVVRVDRVVKHPVYRKYIRRRKKFMAHDETGAAIGDKVRIVETRPLSAQKRWRVIEIIQKAEK